MAKDKDKALAFIQKNTKISVFEEGFEAREAAKSANFRQEFLVAPLSDEEDMEIQLLLSRTNTTDAKDENQITTDCKTLAEITSQIRAIDRQGVLLHGERIAKARELLKSYGERAFSRWLILAYGNRQTPYSMLQYYDLFSALGNDIQGFLHAMPRKAAYVLATRNGDKDLKIEIIKKYHNKPRDEIVNIIQKTFPLDATDRRGRKEPCTISLKSLKKELMKIDKQRENLSNDAIVELKEIKSLIDDILQKHSPIN